MLKPIIVIHFINYGSLEVSGDYEKDLLAALQHEKVIIVRDKRGEAIVINPKNIVYYRIADAN